MAITPGTLPASSRMETARNWDTGGAHLSSGGFHTDHSDRPTVITLTSGRLQRTARPSNAASGLGIRRCVRTPASRAVRLTFG
jgi:hypothetical protein